MTMTMTNTLQALQDAIVRQTNGRFLTVTFYKKDGTLRRLNGRIGVRYKGKPAEARMDTQDQDYLLIWSVRDRGYRRVSLRSIVRIAADRNVIYSKG